MRSPNRIIAAVLGAGYLLLGGLGFTTTAGLDFATPVGAPFLGALQVNGLQNTVHLVLGAVLLAVAFVSVPVARVANRAVGTVFLLLGLAGLFLAGGPFNVLAINAGDNVLHFASSVLLLAAGLGAEHRARGN
jgi:hypothetical protein